MTQPTEKTTTRGRMGRLRWILLPSLALNILFLGVFVGNAVGDRPDHRVPRVDRMGGPMTFALSHEDRREIGKALHREYRKDRPTRAEVREEYNSIVVALRAEPYDRQRLEVIMADQSANATQRILIGQKLLLDRIEEMSAEERRAFATRLEEGLKRSDRGLDEKGRMGADIAPKGDNDRP